jgi:hypothetical protein
MDNVQNCDIYTEIPLPQIFKPHNTKIDVRIEVIVIEPTHIKRAPHRTVPEGRGPRLSRQVKADLRYGRGLSPHIWFSDLKTLPPLARPYLRSRHPGPDST